MDTYEAIISEIERLIPKAESGAQWAEICRLEAEAVKLDPDATIRSEVQS